jgi:hypothetical protein
VISRECLSRASIAILAVKESSLLRPPAHGACFIENGSTGGDEPEEIPLSIAH